MLSKFIWSFKVGDNLNYNFEVLFFLYGKKDIEQTNQELYIKPLIVIIVSIIEGIFYDLMCRLDGATNHFPKHIDPNTRNEIKKRIHEEKVPYKTTEGVTYRRIRNYTFNHLIKFFEEYELLGSKGASIYLELQEAAYLRNRIHIFNYYNNFSKDENRVFSEFRLRNVEKILDSILTIMSSIYQRPFGS